jgi:hypothetical protein
LIIVFINDSFVSEVILMTHADLAREVHYKGMSKERLAQVAIYKHGKSWKDFHAAAEYGKKLGIGLPISERIGCITRMIQSIVTML